MGDGVVDQDVEPSEALDDCRNHSVDCGAIRDVGDAGNRLAAGGFDRCDGLGKLRPLRTCIDGDRGPGGGECRPHGAPEIASAAGDQHDFAGKRVAHTISSQ